MRSTPRFPRGCAALLALATVAGCGGGLEFRQDHRLHFSAPADLQKVSLPMTLSWSMKDFSATGGAQFAVFVDQAPIKPGETLRAAVSSDLCRGKAACPTTDQLNQVDVYTTTRTSLAIPSVPPLPAGTGRKIHTFTVVLMGDDGRRIGEAAWERDVEIPASKVRSS